jgi:intracellular septation protein
VATDRRIFLATGVFIAASLLSLALSKWLLNHLPRMAIVNAVVVTVFGGLTLALQDELFIKLKPTIVNTLFGVILLGGLWMGRPLLPYVLESVMRLTDEGWRKLTLRWGLFFFVLAALNEIVWRNFSTDFWVGFKVWGIMPITIAFALAQTPLILKHEVKEEGQSAVGSGQS